MSGALVVTLRIAPGDATYVFVDGIVKPINCGSAKLAAHIVHCVNTYDALLREREELLADARRYRALRKLPIMVLESAIAGLDNDANLDELADAALASVPA